MGGGTSSYREIEETECVLLWGSNARETHPIFFHHLLKGIRRGARLITIDPRRTSSAQWADMWAGLDVGTDIALSNTMAREIIAAEPRQSRVHPQRDDRDSTSIARRCRTGRSNAAKPRPVSLRQSFAEIAHTFAKAPRAMICWTLGITEHHTAVDNVLALINLGLLTGHVGRWGSGINPLRGQNNVQGGGDMGALPDRLPGFQHVENDEVQAKFDRAWGREGAAGKGLASVADVRGDGAR